MKKAWLRRSLVLDLKQKARITSSGGSCYYGGMMSHTTTHSVNLSAANPRALSFTGGVVSSGGVGPGVRPRCHTSISPQSCLPGFVLSDSETPEPSTDLPVSRPGGTQSTVFARHVRNSKQSGDRKSQEGFPSQTHEDDEESSLSLKEIETML